MEVEGGGGGIGGGNIEGYTKGIPKDSLPGKDFVLLKCWLLLLSLLLLARSPSCHNNV